MKNEVFNSKARTELVYQHVQDYYNNKVTEWDEPISSESDDGENQDESNNQDSEEDDRGVRRPK